MSHTLGGQIYPSVSITVPQGWPSSRILSPVLKTQIGSLSIGKRGVRKKAGLPSHLPTHSPQRSWDSSGGVGMGIGVLFLSRTSRLSKVATCSE